MSRLYTIILLINLYAEYIMWNARLDEAQAGIKIARRNINNLKYADDTTLMAESEEELKRLLMKMKEESEKASLKFSIQKMKIMASLQLPASEIKRNFLSANLACSLAFKRWFARSHTFQKHLYAHQFSSVALSCLTLCDPVDCSTPGFPVHHQLLELAQTYIHWVSIAV